MPEIDNVRFLSFGRCHRLGIDRSELGRYSVRFDVEISSKWGGNGRSFSNVVGKEIENDARGIFGRVSVNLKDASGSMLHITSKRRRELLRNRDSSVAFKTNLNRGGKHDIIDAKDREIRAEFQEGDK